MTPDRWPARPWPARSWPARPWPAQTEGYAPQPRRYRPPLSFRPPHRFGDRRHEPRERWLV